MPCVASYRLRSGISATVLQTLKKFISQHLEVKIKGKRSHIIDFGVFVFPSARVKPRAYLLLYMCSTSSYTQKPKIIYVLGTRCKVFKNLSQCLE